MTQHQWSDPLFIKLSPKFFLTAWCTGEFKGPYCTAWSNAVAYSMPMAGQTQWESWDFVERNGVCVVLMAMVFWLYQFSIAVVLLGSACFCIFRWNCNCLKFLCMMKVTNRGFQPDFYARSPSLLDFGDMVCALISQSSQQNLTSM